KSPEGDRDPYQQLTDREREVLKLVAEGHTAREIADLLVVSPKTVEWYKASLMNKLNIHNKTDLIRFAIRKSIITP
ncbi:MAG: helix-turn-helix transcriptional regulator, partial [Chloroflexi bacterium]|nr:helix-turn-helix transcriptional regulator [Chloroflexota bacterium]